MQKTITTIIALLMVSGCACNLEKAEPCTGSVVKGCVPTVYFDSDETVLVKDSEKKEAQLIITNDLETEQSVIVKEPKKDSKESTVDEDSETDSEQLRLSAESEEYLKGWVVDKMKRWPTMEMRIVGYADSLGYPEYNMELSQKYAETVRDFLVLQGIDPAKITIEAKGNSELLTEDIAHRDLNRRVEIHMNFPKRFGIF